MLVTDAVATILTKLGAPRHAETPRSRDIPELTVNVLVDGGVRCAQETRVGGGWLYSPNVSRGLTFQRCVAAGLPRPSSVTWWERGCCLTVLGEGMLDRQTDVPAETWMVDHIKACQPCRERHDWFVVVGGYDVAGWTLDD
jgi:hypothetical protein